MSQVFQPAQTAEEKAHNHRLGCSEYGYPYKEIVRIPQSNENASELYKTYYRKPAKFLTDIVRMDLDQWQEDLCDVFFEFDRFAISSGHSSGKSAFTAGIAIYFMTFHVNPAIIITANTENQLKNKTMRELAKWHKKCLIRDWYKWSATKFAMVGHESTWFAEATPQTEHNSEAFAGTHEKFVLQIFDEASAIQSSIYEVAEGATATEGGYRKWFCFGNPTQNSGAFYDACFGEQSHRWHQIIIDTRKCKYADQVQIQAWKEDYGEDSDFFRVRVLGLPPQQSITTLISQADVDRALDRFIPIESYRYAPKILGVDCARFGDDETSICFRQGLQVHWIKSWRGLNEIEIATKVISEIKDLAPQGIFFDNTGGYGAGALDIVQSLGYSATPVHFASTDGIAEQMQNKRMDMWESVRAWLADNAVSLPNDQFLARELVTPEYGYNKLTGKKQLESKEEIKKRLGRSPDRADALCLTFAYPISQVEPEREFSEAEKDWRAVTGLGEGTDGAFILS